jgi:uncharacterized protein (DUF58 family)
MINKKKFFKVDLVPAIKRLEIISKGLVNTKVLGGYLSVFKGRGLEFADYAHYNPDEDSRSIDWKATARTGDLLMREYVEERDINVFFVIDASSNMLFGSIDKLKIEYVIELVAGLSHAALEAGDRVGFVLVGDKVMKKVHPDKGKKQFYIISKSLLDPELYGGNFNFKEASGFLLNYLEETTVVIIISDFANFNEKNEESLKLISKKFDVIGIMIKDPRDRTLPRDSGQVVISDSTGKKTLVVETELVKDAYEKEVKNQEKKIRDIFYKAGADFIDIQTNSSYAEPIIGLFRARALKWK